METQIIGNSFVWFAGDRGSPLSSYSSCCCCSSSSLPLSKRINAAAAAAAAISSAWFPPPRGPRVKKISLLLDRKLKISPLSSPHLQVEDNCIGSQKETTDPSKTVHVRFVLEKKCMFGQHFLLVGDDPALGLWDPSSAIPLEWSDGHVWTVELDLPVKKEIRFKFMLLDISREIKWQPGPDRILQPLETSNTIVVAGNWEEGGNQIITDMDLPGVHYRDIRTKSMIDSNEQNLVAEKEHFESLEVKQSTINENPKQIDHQDDEIKESTINGSFTQKEQQNDEIKESTLNGNSTQKKHQDNKIKENTINGNLTEKDHRDDETKHIFLIPGLVLIPTPDLSSPKFLSALPVPGLSTSAPESQSASLISAVSAEANEYDLVQLLGREDKPDGSGVEQIGEETIELSQPAGDSYEQSPQNNDVIANEDLQSKENSNIVSSRILGNDMEWARKAWEKFLLELGFHPNPFF